MKAGWNLPSWNKRGMLAFSRPIETVLMEYDGPQLATFRDSKIRFLGVVSDEDRYARRWLQATISDLEIDALRSGSHAMRQVFMKENLWVVDQDHNGNYINSWIVQYSDLPEFSLPAPAAVLPDFAIEELDELVGSNRRRGNGLAVGGKGVIDNTIDMMALSKLSGSFQKFCTEVASAIAGENRSIFPIGWSASDLSRLRAVATPPGSFSISIDPVNAAAFRKIIDEYQALVFACNDNERLIPLLSRLRFHVEQSYGKFIKSISDNGLEVLATFERKSVFMNDVCARHIQETIQVQRRQPSTRTEEVPMIGSFVGLSLGPRSGSFELRNLDTGRRIKGQLSHDIFIRLSNDEKIIFGGGALHHVVVQYRYFSENGREREERELVYFKPMGI